MVQVRQVIAGTPPVTGISTLKNLQDINDSDRQDNAFLVWNTDTQKHEYYILAGFNKDSAFNQYSFSPDELDIENLTVNDSATISYATINQGVLNGVTIGQDYAGAATFTSLSATTGFSIAGLTFPTTDGVSGQALVTDGNGNITFAFAGDSESGIVVNSMADLSDVTSLEFEERSEGSYLRYDSANSYYEPRDFDSDALAAALAGLSFTDAGGLGSFTYSNGSGTYTGPSITDIRSLFSVSGDLAYDSATGQFSYTDPASTAYTQTNFDSDLATKTTDDLAEGTNLYYTTERADSDALTVFNVQFNSKTTDNLPQGSTNFYYTEGKFNTSLGTKTTDDLAEGTNLYYTTARADSAATDLITRAFVKGLGIDFDDVTDNGATTTNNVTVGQITTTSGAIVHTVSTATVSSDTITAIDTTAHDSDYLSLEYSLLAFNDSASESQTAKVLVTYDKTRVASTEYGVVFTGDSDLGNYTVDLTNGEVRLLFQRRPANTITLKTTKTVIK